MTMREKCNDLWPALIALCLIFIPDAAFAGGISEFASPLESVVNTLQGPAGRSICVIMIKVCAIGHWLQRGEELSGIFKALTGLVVIISLVSFSDAIISKLFTFKGALI